MSRPYERTIVYAYTKKKDGTFEYECCINVDQIIALRYRSALKYYQVILSCPPLDLDTAGGDALLDCPDGYTFRNLYVKEETINKLFNICG